ncbi:MAG TPA: HipA family kinase [Ktedonobacterales bacterium]
MRTALATRYVTPLREGGSLPGLMEADDDGLYVVKYRGAGQGRRALIAELVGGEIARALGLPVPEIIFIEVDPALGRNEPDYEIRSLILRSEGRNLGIDFLPGALPYSAAAPAPIDPVLASSIVWLDSYITNIDRTARNTNMLIWAKRLWLIDHGAALYFHHTWANYLPRAADPFKAVKDHVLLSLASRLEEVNGMMRVRLTHEALSAIVALVPDEWLGDEPLFPDVAAHRAAYVAYLERRRDASAAFVKEALDARAHIA